MIALQMFERWTGRAVHWDVSAFVIVVTVILAFYYSWRSERKKRIKAERRNEQTLRIGDEPKELFPFYSLLQTYKFGITVTLGITNQNSQTITLESAVLKFDDKVLKSDGGLWVRLPYEIENERIAYATYDKRVKFTQGIGLPYTMSFIIYPEYPEEYEVTTSIKEEIEALSEKSFSIILTDGYGNQFVYSDSFPTNFLSRAEVTSGFH